MDSFSLSDFLGYARERMLDPDESLPCEPEDCAAVMGWLSALVPEFALDQDASATAIETRAADRKQALLASLRKARGAAPARPARSAPPSSDSNGQASYDAGGDDADAGEAA